MTARRMRTTKRTPPRPLPRCDTIPTKGDDSESSSLMMLKSSTFRWIRCSLDLFGFAVRKTLGLTVKTWRFFYSKTWDFFHDLTMKHRDENLNDGTNCDGISPASPDELRIVILVILRCCPSLASTQTHIIVILCYFSVKTVLSLAVVKHQCGRSSHCLVMVDAIFVICHMHPQSSKI